MRYVPNTTVQIMATVAHFKINAEKVYDEDEAKKILDITKDNIMNTIRQEDMKVKWLVIGFPYGIGSHYIMDVIFDGPRELLANIPQGRSGIVGKPTFSIQNADKTTAKNSFPFPAYMMEVI